MQTFPAYCSPVEREVSRRRREVRRRIERVPKTDIFDFEIPWK
jgi:hypothetical protein